MFILVYCMIVVVDYFIVFKIYSQCKIKKSHDNFYADRRIKDGKRSQCTDCQKKVLTIVKLIANVVKK
jgi:hypothetical protein